MSKKLNNLDQELINLETQWKTNSSIKFKEDIGDNLAQHKQEANKIRLEMNLDLLHINPEQWKIKKLIIQSSNHPVSEKVSSNSTRILLQVHIALLMAIFKPESSNSKKTILILSSKNQDSE